MQGLSQYELDFDRAMQYVYQSCKEANTLSEFVLELVNFNNGSFSTLLPQDANFEKIYQFTSGAVLGPIFEEMSIYIYDKMQSNPSWSCIFDDVIRTPDDPLMDLFDSYGLSYDKEVYYYISAENKSPNLISQCLYKSMGFWHSLSLLTKESLSQVKKELTTSQIKEVCIETQIIILGAYDSAGFIIWEKANKT